MNANTKFDDLTIVEQGLILKNGKKKDREISFSELDKIYIKVYKLKPVFELGFILFPFLLIFLSIQYITFEKVMFVGVSTIVPVFVKIKNYKSYGLMICLKDGAVFRKKVTSNVIGQNISIINAVRKERFNYYTKINASHKLESLEFCQNLAVKN